ncbi:MAG: hypothetical protein IT282_14800 [Bacteroidetes bacterium]|nr:hypothetical protein [Bacteroidota bacterium]
MTIDSIMSNTGSADMVRKGRAVGERSTMAEGEAEHGDRVDVSRKAQALYSAGKLEKLEMIRERVRQGYYLHPEITEQVIECVARDIEAATGR